MLEKIIEMYSLIMFGLIVLEIIFGLNFVIKSKSYKETLNTIQQEKYNLLLLTILFLMFPVYSLHVWFGYILYLLIQIHSKKPIQIN